MKRLLLLLLLFINLKKLVGVLFLVLKAITALINRINHEKVKVHLTPKTPEPAGLRTTYRCAYGGAPYLHCLQQNPCLIKF
jgi:hypothetical protein